MVELALGGKLKERARPPNQAPTFSVVVPLLF